MGVSPNIQRAMSIAEDFDMRHVMERYAEKTRLPANVVSEHEREIKRFLAMCAASPRKYAMRGPLDELWHTFILFTSSYAKFCQKVGGRFIHHLPETPSHDKPRGKNGDPYLKFLDDYEAFFREPAPAHLWPRPIGGTMTPSCDECGNFCAQTCVAMEFELEQPR